MKTATLSQYVYIIFSSWFNAYHILLISQKVSKGNQPITLFDIAPNIHFRYLKMSHFHNVVFYDAVRLAEFEKLSCDSFEYCHYIANGRSVQFRLDIFIPTHIFIRHREKEIHFIIACIWTLHAFEYAWINRASIVKMFTVILCLKFLLFREYGFDWELYLDGVCERESVRALNTYANASANKLNKQNASCRTNRTHSAILIWSYIYCVGIGATRCSLPKQNVSLC